MITQSVSVVIPTYNREKKIIQSINSVLNQTYGALEVIVVDDGSTDDTEQLVKSINDDRVRYHRLNCRSGASNARNIGVGLARYDVIAFNDSDDIWHSNKLETQLSYWKEHPECILVYCPYKVDVVDGGSIRIPSEDEELETLEGDIFYYLLFRPTIGTPTILMRKDIFEKSGGFDASYPACIDWEYTVRIARLGKIGFVNDILLTADASGDDRISSSKVAHYKARCMMMAKYLNEINTIGLFEEYVADIMENAAKDGMIELVKEMITQYI